LAPNGSNKTGFIPPITEMRNIIKEVSSAMTELCMMAYNNKMIPMYLKIRDIGRSIISFSKLK
jgi:hypothetical protein